MPRQLAIHWFPLLPAWAILLVVAVLLAIVVWGSRVLARKQVPPRWVVGLGVVRALAVLLFAVCLLQPALSYLKRTTHPPELLMLVDTSQSMAETDAAGQTRLVAAVADLRQTKLLETLDREFELKFFGFDRRAYPIDAAKLDQLEAKGPGTEFAASFAGAGDLLDAESGDGATAARPRRVLLVSDGQDRGGESLADAAARVGATIDVVVAGDDRAQSKSAAEIVRVQAAPRVLLASETQFLVVVRRGEVGPDYVLRLLEDGREVQSQDVAFTGDATERHVRVAHKPTDVGLKRYEFALRPKGEPLTPNPSPTRGEGSSGADRYAVDVQVVDDKIEVLVLEDRWRWEFKYFRRVLEDDPSFNFTAMLARGGGAFLQLGEPERRVNLGSFPQSRAELDWFDLLVLGDVRPSRWPRGLAAAVADSVVEGGKSLVVVAGPTLGELAQVPELNALLPVDIAQESAAPLEGPLEVRLTPEGAAGGIFADEGSPTGPLPAVDRIYPALRKRPAATVLVEAAGEANTAGRLIVLAEQTVGRGRVLFVATDALWKWQTLTPLDNDGRTVYGKFWQQALRALTPRRTATNDLWLQAEQSRYETGERVVVRAEVWADGEEQRKLDGAIVTPDGRRLPIAFEVDAEAARFASDFDVYRAEFDATMPGRYRVALAETVGGEAAGETSTAVEVIANRGETDDAGVDRAALTAIAARTGGKVVEPSDPRTWPTAGGPPPEIDERRTVSLWDNFFLVTLLCLVLGGDWLARMLRGYV